ncbi:hypothetical protein ACOME3_008704 [Neoechinorhynchus agilis]
MVCDFSVCVVFPYPFLFLKIKMIKWTEEALSLHPLDPLQFESDDFLESLKLPKRKSAAEATESSNSSAAPVNDKPVQSHLEFREKQRAKPSIFQRAAFRQKIRSKHFVDIVQNLHNYFLEEGNEREKHQAIVEKQNELMGLKQRLVRINKTAKKQQSETVEDYKYKGSTNQRYAVLMKERAKGSAMPKIVKCKAVNDGAGCRSSVIPVTDYCIEHIHLDKTQCFFPQGHALINSLYVDSLVPNMDDADLSSENMTNNNDGQQ